MEQKLLILFASATVFCLIAAILYPLGKRLDQTKNRLMALKGEDKDYTTEELKKTFSQRILSPMAQRLSASLRRMANRNRRDAKLDAKLEKQLRAAGMHIGAGEFQAIRLVLLLSFLLLGVLAAVALPLPLATRLLLLVLALLTGFVIPGSLVRQRTARRKEQIVHDLPDVMDLLVVSVEAGLGLDAAITRLFERNKCVVLTELSGAVRDVQMGVPRRTAMKEMAQRCDVKELTSFVSALIQAEQLGVSMKSVLIAQSKRLREERRQKIKEKALKAPIKIMIPTVFFIFPVMFIILLGPAVMNIMAIFA